MHFLPQTLKPYYRPGCAKIMSAITIFYFEVHSASRCSITWLFFINHIWGALVSICLGGQSYMALLKTIRFTENADIRKAMAIHWREASDGQEHWLMHWGWLKSDQTCTQANMLAVFPLTTARDRRWWSHCRSLGSPEMSTSFFARQLKKRAVDVPYTPVVSIAMVNLCLVFKTY